jgi:ATP-dependent DNA helicase PIF1
MFSSDQKKAFENFKKGKNIFITGPGGCGKTFLLKAISQYLKEKDIFFGLTSLTGVAATHLDGKTLHSFLGIGLGQQPPLELYNAISNSKKQIWRKLKVLIIDEVSMLSLTLFKKLNFVSKKIRDTENFFGGIQLVLAGDFLQLPSINDEKFCFQTSLWKKNIETIYLNKIFRQKKIASQNLLNNIRLGNLTELDFECLNKLQKNDQIENFCVQLYGTNFNVNKLNEKKLKDLGNEIQEYHYKYYENIKNSLNFLLKNCNADPILKLCVGAKVICLKNFDNSIVNGSQGVVESFNEFNFPIVKFFKNNRRMTFMPHVYDIYYQNTFYGTITQIPLKVSFAMTVHKCQGMTLDYIKINMKDFFDYGHFYVAMSRVKNIENIYIENFSSEKIKVHDKALKFYQKFEAQVDSQTERLMT